MALDSYGRTTYGGGGATTSAFGPRAPYQGTNATDALRALINAERGSGGGSRYPSQRMPRPPAPTLGSGTPGVSAADQRLADMERAARIKQLQASMRPAPQKLIQGANIIPGYVDDPRVMNAFQRQLYLPQSSTAESPAAEAQGEAIRGAEERVAEEAFRALVQRRRATDALGGGPAYGGGGGGVR